MKTTDRSPKILPWLAHKAGIAPPRAETLWLEAQRHAAATTGEAETPAFWKTAMDRLLELMVAETQHEDAGSCGWRGWTRFNRQAWQNSLSLLDTWSLNLTRSWRQWEPLQLG